MYHSARSVLLACLKTSQHKRFWYEGLLYTRPLHRRVDLTSWRARRALDWAAGAAPAAAPR
jgi:hypothetical protein